jgi:hypothetical protein
VEDAINVGGEDVAPIVFGCVLGQLHGQQHSNMQRRC